jgi:predicted dienelactone hydrolase
MLIPLLLACAVEEPAPHFDDPAGDGSFDAVTYEVDQTWQVWYPSDQGTGTEGTRYDDMLAGTAWAGGKAACDQLRPVVVFSHGHRGIRWQSIFLTEQLARHGYIVIAPDHFDNTFMDGDGGATPEIAARRPSEVKDSFDRLLEEPKLSACIDPDAGYAVIGHSFGAFTALAVGGAGIDIEGLTEHCADDPDDLICGAEELLEEAGDPHDPRVWASIPITPGGATAFGDLVSELDVPILVIGAEADTTTPVDENAIPIFEGLTASPRYMAMFHDAGHFTFTDICLMLADFNGCGPEYVEQAVAQEAANVLVLGLLGEARGFDTTASMVTVEAIVDLTAE